MFPAGVAGIRTRMVLLPHGLTLRVAESGEPTARPILLLHGWGASVYMWRDWFAPLARAGWRVLAVDLPGHGLSDKSLDPAVYRLDGQIDTIRALLREESIDEVDIVAQSMAGTVALELALRGERRLRRLALVNPACFGRIRIQPLARAVSPSPIDVLLPRLVARWLVARAHRLVYGDPSRVTPRDVDEYWAPSQFPNYSRAMRRLVHEFTWRRPPADILAQRMRALPVPILVVLGTIDRLVRDSRPYVSALIAAGAPIRMRVVDGGGHAVNEERAQEVIAIVSEFLRETGET